MTLTDKQQRFIESYLVDPNGKKAAIAAGYSAATAEAAASRLLRHVGVAAELQRRRAILSARCAVTADMVLAELAKVGFSDIRQVMGWRAINRQLFNEKGEPVDVPELVLDIRDSGELTPEAAAAVSEISRTKDGAVKIKMHDKLGALVRIGQHLGMFKPLSAEEPGKKEQAQQHSKTAERGTSWDGLLQ